ncbi:Suppressor protein stp22 of temperature-sensitive alpha-factor receptor and arginine permease, variant 2 [Batrachochytrium dendrobatidis]
MQDYSQYQYQSPDRSIMDVEAVLKDHPGLGPKTDLYTQNDGRQLVLLCISGTIQINFSGSVYNIPIALWLPSTYPSQPPFAHVLPTPTMVIKPSKHVDISGRVYHPFLAYWHLRPDSTLQQFLKVLQEIFSAESPVYAKSAAPFNSAPATLYGSSNSTTSPLSANPQTPPPFPAPWQPGSGAYPQWQQQYGQPVGQGSLPANPNSTQMHSSLPGTPVIPPKRPTSMVQPGAFDYGDLQHPQTTSPIPSPSRMQGTASLPRPIPSNPTQLSSNSLNTSTPPNRRISSPLMSNMAITHQPLKPSFTGHAIPDATTLETHTKRTQLQTKLKEKLAYFDQTMSVDIDRLLSLSKTLTEGEKRVSDLIRYLTDIESKLKVNCHTFETEIQNVEKKLDTLKSMPSVDIDTYLIGGTKLENQAFELSAENHAIDDVIYNLARGFGGSSRQNDVTQYLKHVRSLAREQFMKRALLKKVKVQIEKYRTPR